MARAPILRKIDHSVFNNIPAESRKAVLQLVNVINPFISDVTEALDRGLTVAENSKGAVKVLTVTTPSEWVTLPLSTGWGVWDTGKPAQVRKSPNGWVEFRRLVRTPNAAVANFTKFATVPAGYEMSPEISEQVTTLGYTFSVVGRDTKSLYLSTGSSVLNTWVSLNGLRGYALDPTPLDWTKPIKVKLPAQPRSIQVLAAKNLTTGAYTTGHGVRWKPTQDGILITLVNGLVPETKYELTVAFLA